MHPYWPFFDLRVRTGRLELRVPTDEDLVELVALAARGIHPPEVMPFGWTFTDRPSPELERELLQRHWLWRAELQPDGWNLDFVVRAEGTLVGVQGISATKFPVLRAVRTASWLGKDHQRRGIGTEMRAAILHLAFAGLGAEVATTDAYFDNAASERVSRKLGYEPNGIDLNPRRGAAAETHRFRLTRARWEAGPRPEVRLEGLEGCLGLLGATARP
jgi:RimJ/RimL family protein N-acetyltransferase